MNDKTSANTYQYVAGSADEDLNKGLPGMKLNFDFASEAKYEPGRRAFFKYRNLGLGEASGGRMRSFQNTSIAGMLDSTGWHYHLCQFQFVYLLQGELILEFEDGRAVYLTKGDTMFIPGGVKHNEIYVSEDKDSVEVSLPIEIGTVPCERPAHLPEQLECIGAVDLVTKKMQAELAARKSAT